MITKLNFLGLCEMKLMSYSFHCTSCLINCTIVKMLHYTYKRYHTSNYFFLITNQRELQKMDERDNMGFLNRFIGRSKDFDSHWMPINSYSLFGPNCYEVLFIIQIKVDFGLIEI